MSSDNHRAFIVSSNLGRAHDYDPAVFPLARLKKNTLEVGKLCISTSLREITMARRLIQDQSEFKRIFEDVEHQCHEMTKQGDELERRSKTWNLLKRLRVRRDIKKFGETSFDLYILTVRKSKIIDQLPLAVVLSEGITPVSVDEVSPTEPVDGLLITVDDDVDIDQAKREIAETVNKLTSTYELQENPDAGCSDTLSIAPSELSYLTARTSCETDQPNPCSIDRPASLSNHDIRSGVPPAGHWPPTTPSLPFTIHSFSPMNPPPTNSFPMSPPPTGPPPTDPPSAPTATSSLRADSPPPVFNFQNNTFVCTNLLLHALNDLRLNSGNGSNFSDHNSGASNMETFPQEFVPTSPSN